MPLITKISVWDIHDVIGAKPLWFYARCLENYFAGWEDGSNSSPSIAEDEFTQTCVDQLGVKETACQCDFDRPDSEAAQPAEERILPEGLERPPGLEKTVYPALPAR